VLKTRKDSDSHPPLPPGGGLPVCTGPNYLKILISNCEEKDYYLSSRTYRKGFNMMNTSFFVGRVSIVPERSSRFRTIRCKLFEAMHRNALDATEFFRIPPNRVIELGGQVAI